MQTGVDGRLAAALRKCCPLEAHASPQTDQRELVPPASGETAQLRETVKLQLTVATFLRGLSMGS